MSWSIDKTQLSLINIVQIIIDTEKKKLHILYHTWSNLQSTIPAVCMLLLLLAVCRSEEQTTNTYGSAKKSKRKKKNESYKHKKQIHLDV